MRLCLDTSAYSAFMKGHEEVVDLIQRAKQIVFTPIVLGELFSGFRRGKWQDQNLDLLDRFLDSPRVISISVDDETSLRYADIVDYLRRAGTPVPSHDLWIAASAMQYGLTVVSTDSHFEKVPEISRHTFSP